MTSRVVDAVLLEVVRNRLTALADEMELSLLRAAYSAIVKEGLDASAAVFDAKGQMIAQAAAIPIHLGCLIPAVEQILTSFPREGMAPGDVYVLNDPYQGGTHLPDIVLVMPVFAHHRLVAFTTTMCHHQEIGGMVPGSLPPNATDLFQEGLRIPPLKLVDRGQPVEPLFAILRSNVRVPDAVLGDLRAQLAAGEVGRRRVVDLLASLATPDGATSDGVAVWEGICDELVRRSELLTRERIAAIPDGTYRFEDYMDDDGVRIGQPVRIRAAVTVQGSELHVDFTGTSRQLAGPFNCVRSSTLSAVYYVVRAVTGPDIPNNSGCYRSVRITAPPGSMVDPLPPAPVNSRTASVKRLVDALMGCFVQALPGRLPAASCGQLLVMNFGGVDPLTGRAFVTSELGAGGMGARPGMDGVDGIETDATNCMNIPAEAIESDSPLRIDRWELWRDSGGAGQWRGGLGFHKVFHLTRGEATATYRGERHTTRPGGVCGGRPAARSRAWVERADGATERLLSKQILYLRAGDRLHVCVGGGGGYGDPLRRPPERVAEDVADGRVSPGAARSDYGVIVDDGGRLDAAATDTLRRSMAGRGAAELFDRGELPAALAAAE
ncbi:MAG TPA: hydantoinase B/oxoprolinase family protein [Chloroflexota bacterium]|nr:hydantoinase B/oxoprolinase family protein [Chloroflexota bacterium]